MGWDGVGKTRLEAPADSRDMGEGRWGLGAGLHGAFAPGPGTSPGGDPSPGPAPLPAGAAGPAGLELPLTAPGWVRAGQTDRQTASGVGLVCPAVCSVLQLV